MESYSRILEQFITSHPRAAVAEIEKLSDQEIMEYLVSIPSQLAAGFLVHMERFRAARILLQLEQPTSSAIMEAMPEISVLDLIRIQNLPDQEKLLSGLQAQKQNNLRDVLNFPGDCVGAYLDPGVFTLFQDQSVSESIEQIKNHTLQVYSYIMVIDSERKLTGYVTIKDLIKSEPQSKIRTIMKEDPPCILADTVVSSPALKATISQLPFHNIPVVNVGGTFLGVISIDRLSKLEVGDESLHRQALQAGSALGDLYQIGLLSLFRSTGA